MPIGAGIAGLGSLAGSLISSRAASRAANAQEQGAREAIAVQERLGNRALDLQERAYNDTGPWRTAGRGALTMLSDALGMNGPEGTSRATGSFRMSPGYEFAFGQGMRGVNAAFPGMTLSGKRVKAASRFGQGLADQDYGGWIGRLQTMAGYGQNANAQGANISANSGSLLERLGANLGSAYQDAAAARASGYVGSANAWSSGLSQLGRLAGGFGGF